MALDPSIILGYRPPQIQSPMEGQQQMLTLAKLMQDQRLGQMQMEDAVDARARAKTMRELLAGVTDPKQAPALLRSKGFWKEAGDYEKSMLDAENTRSQIDERGAKAGKERQETDDKVRAAYYELWGRVGDEAGADALIRFAHANPAIKKFLPGTVDDDIADMRRHAADPAKFREYVVRQHRGMREALELGKPAVTQRDNGGTTDLLAVTAYDPIPRVVATTQKTMTPGEVATDRRARERLDWEKKKDGDAAVADAGGPDQAPLVKRFGKAQPGYRWKPDGTLEAIPGGPVDMKAGKEGEARDKRKTAEVAQAKSVRSTIADADKLVSGYTAGVGSWLSVLPATEARDLAAKLETIKANLGFDRLQQMRDMSPTGGALGQVAVQELIALQSTIASLDQAQKPEQLKAALKKIDQHYAKWLSTLTGSDTERTVKRTGTANGRKVVEYNDGTIEYAD